MSPIYLDNAATTRLAPEVLEAMLPYLKGSYGNPSAAHQMGSRAKGAIEAARREMSTRLHAGAGDIYFTSSGTEAGNWALKGVLAPYQIQHIITSPIEHPAVLRTVAHISQGQGIPHHFVKVGKEGHVDYEDLATLLKSKPKALVSLMHGHNELGNLTDIARVGRLCQQHGALFHTDIVQTLGCVKLDLKTLPVDLATASAHKLHGPKGVGMLYVRGGIRLAPQLHGGAQEKGARAGTENVAGIVGFAKALAMAYDNHDQYRSHLLQLKAALIQQIFHHLPQVAFTGGLATSESLPHILHLTLPGHVDGETLILNLSMRGLYAAAGSACSSGATSRSHVADVLGIPPTRALLRLSISRYTTHEEVKRAVACLREVIGH